MEDNQQEGDQNENREDEVNQNVNQQDEVNQDGLALGVLDPKTLDLFFDTIFGSSAKLTLLNKNIDHLFLDQLEDLDNMTQRKLELCKREQLLKFAKYMGRELPSITKKADIIKTLGDILKEKRRGLTDDKIRIATQKIFKIRMMDPLTDADFRKKQVLTNKVIDKIAVLLEIEEKDLNEDIREHITEIWAAELDAFLARREALDLPTDEEVLNAVRKVSKIVQGVRKLRTLTLNELRAQVAILLEKEVHVIGGMVTEKIYLDEFYKLEFENQEEEAAAVANVGAEEEEAVEGELDEDDDDNGLEDNIDNEEDDDNDLEDNIDHEEDDDNDLEDNIDNEEDNGNDLEDNIDNEEDDDNDLEDNIDNQEDDDNDNDMENNDEEDDGDIADDSGEDSESSEDSDSSYSSFDDDYPSFHDYPDSDDDSD